jgi:hypothetical protein
VLFKEETVKRYMPLVLLAMVALVAAQAGATNLIQNGTFASGDFTDWTVGTTGNGTWGSGFPVVTGWPLGGMNAAEGEVGEVNFTGLQEGGTLKQSFASAGGAATISMDWLASAPFAGNADGGEFTMILNGVQIAQFDTGNINQGQMLNGVLTANANLLNGSNTLEIDVTRRFITVPQLTPLQYVTAVDVEGQGVPEPGSLVLMGSGVLGLAGVLRRKIGF